MEKDREETTFHVADNIVLWTSYEYKKALRSNMGPNRFISIISANPAESET